MRQLIIPIIAFSLFLMHCDKTTEPQPPQCGPISDPSKQIEIVSPTANEELKIGETINIQWKAKPGLGSVGLRFENNIGAYKNIIDNSLLIPDGQDVACMNFDWVVGKFGNTMIDKDTVIYLVVYNYNDQRENDRVQVTLKK